MSSSGVQNPDNADSSLVDRLQHTGNGEIILELDGDSLVRQSLEYRENQLEDKN